MANDVRTEFDASAFNTTDTEMASGMSDFSSTGSNMNSTVEEAAGSSASSTFMGGAAGGQVGNMIESTITEHMNTLGSTLEKIQEMREKNAKDLATATEEGVDTIKQATDKNYYV